jgi:hypothetical protein
MKAGNKEGKMNNRNRIKVLEMVSHDRELLALFSGMVFTAIALLTMAVAAGIRLF